MHRSGRRLHTLVSRWECENLLKTRGCILEATDSENCLFSPKRKGQKVLKERVFIHKQRLPLESNLAFNYVVICNTWP